MPLRNEAKNAALFNPAHKPDFLKDALARVIKLQSTLVVTDDSHFLPLVPTTRRIGFAALGLDKAPIDAGSVREALQHKLEGRSTGLAVDMRWAISNVEGVTSLERWGAVADLLSGTFQKPVVSIYDQDLVIEEQMQVALRAHRLLLAPSGLHANPYWMPAALLEKASVDEQLAFMLGRVVADYQDFSQRRKGGEMFARGATPSWLPTSGMALGSSPSSQRWHIHCFGPLRVIIGGRPVDWRITGSTPKKTRTLFAYLLQTGEKGAHAEQLSELLWPDEESEDVKRARLHHTVAMLRKTLSDTGSVLRNGDFYRLNPPAGSWIDIDTFEQLCRRGLSLFKKGDTEASLHPYLAAHQLYAGDLFEDLPREYTESEHENWCMPRRTWLREMALKLQTDMTKALIMTGRTREALEHCMKALSLDPASESANADAMRIFQAQGRQEAVHRQYRQYKQAVAAVGATESAELKNLLRDLTT
jgi:DNA-binding SARP family transcriptional activator